MTLDEKLNQVKVRLTDEKLKYLFECFYCRLDKDDSNDQAKLNIALPQAQFKATLLTRKTL